VDEQVTLVARPATANPASSSGFRALDSEAQRRSSRNLAIVATVYATVYAAAFLTGWLLHVSSIGRWHWPALDESLITLVSIGLSIVVTQKCWKCDVASGAFTRTAQIFAVAAAFGIAIHSWGWESDILESGIDERIEVAWVGIWILAFPSIVTLDPGRVLRTSLLSALTLPAVGLTSLAAHGVPDNTVGFTEREAVLVVVRITIPTLICAGIAVFTAHHVFGLAREASEARQLGSYRLVEKLGAGGMGEVWSAEHRLLARPAAIKLVRADVLASRSEGMTAETALRRFEREARATAFLTSPHTIELYDFGVTPDGAFYYVMELLQGLDLRTLVERDGPVPPARAIRFLRQACHSLADAHHAGMIHRDVKPANLFTCRRGLEYDFVKVLDFGLVKEAGPSNARGTQLTMEGVASGTPAFMAPELALNSRAIDGRVDLYALGCVAYWLLTGHLVFDGETAMAMVVRHVNEEPAPPSSRSEHEIDPELDRIILDCLAKDPDARPRSAQELSERLVAVERRIGEWSPERAERWWRAHLPQYVAKETAPAASAFQVETA
jgi:serine/threonine-protein kinase